MTFDNGHAFAPTRDSIDPAAVHSIIYTSGTTGHPKGAMITHGNLFWSAFGSLVQLGLDPADRWLAVLPLCHVGGLSILVRGVINGTTSVIHESFDPARANRAVDEEGVTIVSLVATMLQRMLDERGDRPYPSTLRCILLGGGPVPDDLVERGLRLGLPIAQTYGLTETASQAVTLRLPEIPLKPGSAGRPLLPTEVRIEREDGSLCEAGEAGEIAVRGPTVSPGYFRRPAESERTLRDGWLHTGDAGYLDGDGYLYVLDRRDDVIISGGENVYPAEVESVLGSHPAVREAGVFALPDAAWGQMVAAAVCLRSGAEASVDDLQSFCRERIAGYKVPKAIHFIEELPRTASGKLLRRELRDTYSRAST
jgi:O-succinylbenzoic acid--CoA ligase